MRIPGASLFLVALLVTLFLFQTLTTQSLSNEEKAAAFQPSFFAFRNGVSFGGPEKEAATLKELGYNGISQVYDRDDLATYMKAYQKAGLRILSVYLNVDDQPIAAAKVELLRDSDALIELTVRRMTSKTVEAVRQTAEMAAELKIRVALYPHHGFAVATMPQALDLIEKVNHPNLGVMFNLCHFLKNEKAASLETILEKAGSRLFAVSTCGADIDGKNWNQLIQPLHQGSFPQKRLFTALKRLKFNGPVGLQCYAVPGDKRTNLKNSMEAWRKLLKEL